MGIALSDFVEHRALLTIASIDTYQRDQFSDGGYDIGRSITESRYIRSRELLIL
jgi:hypothetical protein